MGTCSRCGRTGHTEYGSDGQPYCSACIFYGLNRQCWRCRMYLPYSEFQQYRGQWICPNCLMDIRDEEKSRSDNMLKRYSYSERCERCGRETNTFYMWNGRRLCMTCLNEEKSTWGTVGGGPSAGSSKIIIRPLRVSDEPSLLGRILSAILIRLGLKKKEGPEIVAIRPQQTAFNRAKTLTEGEIKEKERPAEVEGIMKDDDRVQTEGIVNKKSSKKKKKPKKKK